MAVYPKQTSIVCQTKANTHLVAATITQLLLKPHWFSCFNREEVSKCLSTAQWNESGEALLTAAQTCFRSHSEQTLVLWAFPLHYRYCIFISAKA